MNILDKLLVAALPVIPRPLVGRISSRYIAGEHAGDAIRVIRKLNRERFTATVDILGEHAERREHASRTADDYVRLLEDIHRHALDCTISVKLTHLGLKLDDGFCRDNLRRLAGAAKTRGNFVRIDMEDASCTDATLRMHRELRKDFDNVGVVLQSCLRRTMTDARRLLDGDADVNVRLCKGIYVEDAAIAYRAGKRVDRNYVRVLRELLGRGATVGIATHDEKLVREAFRLIEELKLPPHRYEFQMLLGVAAPLRRLIRDAGHRLRVYVPFGSQWYDYSVRRLKENPRIAGYVLKNMLRQPRR